MILTLLAFSLFKERQRKEASKELTLIEDVR